VIQGTEKAPRNIIGWVYHECQGLPRRSFHPQGLHRRLTRKQRGGESIKGMELWHFLRLDEPRLKNHAHWATAVQSITFTSKDMDLAKRCCPECEPVCEPPTGVPSSLPHLSKIKVAPLSDMCTIGRGVSVPAGTAATGRTEVACMSLSRRGELSMINHFQNPKVARVAGAKDDICLG
jgi:hypothetical protein